ncbi:hypothetical protein C1J02_10370 [Sulfitobacter sp. SK011]|nr:hypothetical protein C1J02_10370 [Sulfitobacter sp. SK011]
MRMMRMANLGIWVFVPAFMAFSAHAQTQEMPSGQTPLSVIDWLGTQGPATTGQLPSQIPEGQQSTEPPVTKSGTPPVVTVAPLGEGSPREIGLVPTAVTGLPTDIWAGSDADQIIKKIKDLADPTLPAAQALLYTVLLAEAQAPRGGVAAGDALALARVEKLVTLGALDPALSLIEQAGVTTSPDHFDLWMQISLLNGTEDRACATLAGAPHLTRDYGTRIFCAARAGNWDNAALTFGSAQALGLMSDEKLDLIDRFLNPDAYEGAPPLRAPRKMDPLSFRLFETIGEPLPTGNLARPYAVADLRDVAGWKAQLEAAERLTRLGALPDNRLLGLYTDRQAAASGGIWDRVSALQRFETALNTGSAEAVAKTLPTVWAAMHEAGLEVSFATLFADPLAQIPLTGRAADIAFEIALLSPAYEVASVNAQQKSLLTAIGIGEMPEKAPDDVMERAVFEAFTTATPRADLIAGTRQKRLGESILILLDLLHDGAGGDAGALRDALATLRALGLEDTARRLALQTLLLER